MYANVSENALDCLWGIRILIGIHTTSMFHFWASRKVLQQVFTSFSKVVSGSRAGESIIQTGGVLTPVYVWINSHVTPLQLGEGIQWSPPTASFGMFFHSPKISDVRRRKYHCMWSKNPPLTENQRMPFLHYSTLNLLFVFLPQPTVSQRMANVGLLSGQCWTSARRFCLQLVREGPTVQTISHLIMLIVHSGLGTKSFDFIHGVQLLPFSQIQMSLLNNGAKSNNNKLYLYLYK